MFHTFNQERAHIIAIRATELLMALRKQETAERQLDFYALEPGNRLFQVDVQFWQCIDGT